MSTQPEMYDQPPSLYGAASMINAHSTGAQIVAFPKEKVMTRKRHKLPLKRADWPRIRDTKKEGKGLASDDPNPVLLTNPEFKAEAREEHMPNVRRFFRYKGRTYYERHGDKWQPVGEARIYGRISERIREECGYEIWPKSHAACLEELKLEAKR